MLVLPYAFPLRGRWQPKGLTDEVHSNNHTTKLNFREEYVNG